MPFWCIELLHERRKVSFNNFGCSFSQFSIEQMGKNPIVK
jgi:hypothetical protein